LANKTFIVVFGCFGWYSLDGKGILGMDLVLPQIDHEKCTLCGDCIDACQRLALAIQNKQVVFAKPELCNYCADCESRCPQAAIRVEYEIGW